MGISVIVPSYNTPREYLENLYRSLLRQTWNDYEVFMIDDHSTFRHYDCFKDSRFKIIYKPFNSGPADCRNIGAQLARHDVLFFTDSDCELSPETLEVISKGMVDHDITTGNTITKIETCFGKAVAFLGFPGGGIIGFDQVWRVDKQGFAESFSSCNVAMKKEIFHSVGAYDTTFSVPGGEDTVFARRAITAGYKIRYMPNQIVFHVERGDLKGFIRWQITRGRGNYHIKKKLGKIRNFFKLRFWSFKNSLLKSGIGYAPAVLFLIASSIVFQGIGYWLENRKRKMED
jgi:glycosyltransferase involved in cell wall biosynthesis